MFAQIFPSIGQDRVPPVDTEQGIRWPDRNQQKKQSWVLNARVATDGEPPDKSELSGTLFELWNKAEVDSDTDETLPQVRSDFNSESVSPSTYESKTSQQASINLSTQSERRASNTASDNSRSKQIITYMWPLLRGSRTGQSKSAEPMWSREPDDSEPDDPEPNDPKPDDPKQRHLKRQPLFPRWPRGIGYPLTPEGMFTQEQYLDTLKLWQALKLNVNVNAGVGGGGVELEGWFALLRNWFHPTRWLSLWRGTARTIIVPSSEDQAESPTLHEDLTDLDMELFGTTKYWGGDSNYLTVITYDEEDNGAISLYQVMRKNNLASRVDLIAYMDEVPQRVLRMTKKRVSPNRIDILYTSSGLTVRMTGGQPEPTIVDVTDNTGAAWCESGSGWSFALRLTELASGGLAATIPQILAFCHLRVRNLTRLESSPVFEFEPLSIPEQERDDLRRGVKLVTQAEGYAHQGNNVRIAVLFPKENPWSEEVFFWA
ncbi:hypothetical protein N7460_000305 [Penicillium canescens]|uniref:Uncharacterized protein n=2 Tax=Penicillium canescens TaxID=5083 RepID=A0AAD6IMD3_PENCN|nr:hypothetical protein N7460_000305 [Penicillium canescens]